MLACCSCQLRSSGSCPCRSSSGVKLSSPHSKTSEPEEKSCRITGALWPAWPPTPSAAPALDQRLCGGAGRCAGGKDVVDYQNVLCPSTVAGSETERRRAHSGAAGAGEAGLARRGAQPHQGAGSQREPPLRMRFAQKPSACSASARAWLNPRSAYLDRCSGTGTTSISRAPRAPTGRWPRASIGPALCRGCSRSYLSA
jgi:hypothetical protein